MHRITHDSPLPALRGLAAMLLIAASSLAPAQASAAAGTQPGPIAPTAPGSDGSRPGGKPAQVTPGTELDAMRSEERSSQCSEATLPQEAVPVCRPTPAPDASLAPPAESPAPR